MYTVTQLAAKLNVSKAFVYDLLTSGRLKHHALGRGQGGKRVSEGQLQAYLAETERGGEERAARPRARRRQGPAPSSRYFPV